MRLAEQVTFGTSGLDRAGWLRDRPGEMAGHLAAGAGVLALWRGKPLVDGEGRLVWLPRQHAVMAQAAVPELFLGLDAGVPRFAADISAWEPETGPLPDGAFVDPTVQVHPDAPEGAGFQELRSLLGVLSRREGELAATAKAMLDWHRGHGFCAACGTRSQPAPGGWSRLCPECGRRHFPRTDPVVIMLITLGNDVLLGRSPGWPEGMYSLLAGFVEPGETIENAVRREVFEEAGIAVGPVGYLSSQPWPFPASLMLGCHGEATSRALEIDPAEIEAAAWVSREELAEAFAGRHPLIRAPRTGAIAHFLLENWLADRLD